MNAKKVKAIRREAQSMAVGVPKVAYEPLRQRVVHLGLTPIPGKDFAIFTGEVRMVRMCERAIYQNLKKIVRRNAAAGLH